MAGLLFGWYFTFSCYKFSKDSAQDTMLGILLGTASLFFVIGIVHLGAKLEFGAAKTLWCGARGTAGASPWLRRLPRVTPLSPSASPPPSVRVRRKQGQHRGRRAVPVLHRPPLDDAQGPAPPRQLLPQRAAVVGRPGLGGC
jgi:hypothetical protein